MSARDQRLARTICLVCVSYLMSNLPKIALKWSQNEHGYPTLTAVFENVFLLQFTVNFVIYAASNKQYREAYLLLLRLRDLRNRGASVEPTPNLTVPSVRG